MTTKQERICIEYLSVFQESSKQIGSNKWQTFKQIASHTEEKILVANLTKITQGSCKNSHFEKQNEIWNTCECTEKNKSDYQYQEHQVWLNLVKLRAKNSQGLFNIHPTRVSWKRFKWERCVDRQLVPLQQIYGWGGGLMESTPTWSCIKGDNWSEASVIPVNVDEWRQTRNSSWFSVHIQCDTMLTIVSSMQPLLKCGVNCRLSRRHQVEHCSKS